MKTKHKLAISLANKKILEGNKLLEEATQLIDSVEADDIQPMEIFKMAIELAKYTEGGYFK